MASEATTEVKPTTKRRKENQQKADDYKARRSSRSPAAAQAITKLDTDLSELKEMFKGLVGTAALKSPESSRSAQGREHRSGNKYYYNPKANPFGALAESEDENN
jgi:hypothetical protein